MSVFVEQDIVALLKSIAGISALVVDRIYPLSLPQNTTFPAISYQTISDVNGYTMSGEDGLSTSRLQIDCWASDYAAVKDLARKIRSSLSGYSGIAGVSIHAIQRESSQDDDETINGKQIFRVSSDYIIFYSEL